MSELPIKRLSVVKQPFAYTGVDYFGPPLIKLNKKTWTNQVVEKLYGAIIIWTEAIPMVSTILVPSR